MQKNHSATVGLIGLGRQGKRILEALTSSGHTVVVALHTKDPSREAWLQAEYPSVRFIYDVSELLNDTTITHVCIATPVETHVSFAEKVIEAGKAVFLEKPIAAHAEEGQRLLATAASHTARLFVGHIFLYHDCFAALQKAVQHASVDSVSIEKTVRADDNETLTLPVFLDTFIHELSILIGLFGYPEKIALHVEHPEKVGDLLKDPIMDLAFKSCTATISLRQSTSVKLRQFTFNTGDGRYEWINDELYLEQNGSRSRIQKPDMPPLQKELELFLNGGDVEVVERNNQTAVDAVRTLEGLVNL